MTSATTNEARAYSDYFAGYLRREESTEINPVLPSNIQYLESSQFHSIMLVYDDFRNSLASSFQISRSMKNPVSFAATSFIDAIPRNPVSSFADEVKERGMTMLLDAVEDKLVGRLQYNVDKFLKQSLWDLRDSQRGIYDSLKAETNPEQRLGVFLSGISEIQDIVNNPTSYGMKFIRDTLKNSLGILDPNEIDRLANKKEKLLHRVVGRTLIEESTSIIEAIKRTKECDVEGIIRNVNTIFSQVGEELTDIGILIENASSSEERQDLMQMLNEIQYQNMNSEKRVEFIRGKIAEARRNDKTTDADKWTNRLNSNFSREIIEGLETFAQSCNALVLVAQTFNIRIPKDLAKGVQIVQLLPGLATGIIDMCSLQPMGFLAVAQSVMGICGILKGRTNAAGQHQQQLMQSFEQLAKGQAIMMRNQEIMMEGINRLLEGQQTILGSIEQLRRDMVRGFQAVCEGQQKIYERINTLETNFYRMYENMMDEIRFVINQLALANLGIQYIAQTQAEILDCERIYTQLRRNPNNYSLDQRRFHTYQGFINFHNQNPQLINSLHHLSLAFSRIGETNDFLFLTGSDHSNEENLKNYTKQWEFFFQDTLSQYQEEKKKIALGLLLTDAFTFDDLQEKLTIYEKAETSSQEVLPKHIAQLFAAPPPGFSSGTSKYLRAGLYEVQELIKWTNIALHFHYFFEFYKSNNQLYSSQELETVRQTSNKGREMLLDALSRVDLAMAQQRLLSGDIILKFLYEAFFGSDATKKSKAQNLLKNNFILARNFMIYAIRTRLQEKGNLNNLEYYNALCQRSPDVLETKALGKGWNLTWEEKKGEKEKWYANFEERSFPLPLAEQVFEQVFVVPIELSRLKELRMELEKEIARYDLHHFIRRDNPKLLNTYEAIMV